MRIAKTQRWISQPPSSKSLKFVSMHKHKKDYDIDDVVSSVSSDPLELENQAQYDFKEEEPTVKEV